MSGTLIFWSERQRPQLGKPERRAIAAQQPGVLRMTATDDRERGRVAFRDACPRSSDELLVYHVHDESLPTVPRPPRGGPFTTCLLGHDTVALGVQAHDSHF